MGGSWSRLVSCSSYGTEPSHSGSTENNGTVLSRNDRAEYRLPQVTDVTGDVAAGSGPQMINPTGENIEYPPRDFLRYRPTPRRPIRERAHRARTERNMSSERPETEGQEAGQRPSMSQQSEATDRSRYRSRSPLRSPETPEREGMSRPHEEQFRDFRFRNPKIEENCNDVYTRFVTEQEPEGDCPICLMEFEERQRATTSKCGHEFHHQCLLRWIKENPSCPICRYGFLNLRRGHCVRVMAIEYNCTRGPDGVWHSVRFGRIVN